MSYSVSFYLYAFTVVALNCLLVLAAVEFERPERQIFTSCIYFVLLYLYLLYCNNKNICKVQTSHIKELVVQKSNLTTRLKHRRWKTTHRIGVTNLS